jgi:ppGpp synthetase/RelA/SpoT-type nucleotidyltranferase
MLQEFNQTKILSEFDREQGRYEDFARNAAEMLKRILQESAITVHSVTWRCKQRASLAAKLQKPEKTYSVLSDITDVAALRITTYFSDDVDRVAEIVRKEFDVDRSNTVDKRVAIEHDRFGYQSLHYVIALSGGRGDLVENVRFKGLKAEVQIRSILQHAWAEIEHDIGYKSAQSVPREVRRRFARIAGLLELADAEFAAIRTELSNYALSVISEIQDNPSSVELDLASLRALYKIDSKVRKLDRLVAGLMRRRLDEDPDAISEKDVDRLLEMGIASVGELEEIAGREYDTVERFARYWLVLPTDEPSGEDDEEIRSTIGIFYLIYVLLWRSGDRERVVEYLESNSIGLHERGDTADLLLRFVN